MQHISSGFNKVEILDGNIGYIDFWGFDDENNHSKKELPQKTVDEPDIWARLERQSAKSLDQGVIAEVIEHNKRRRYPSDKTSDEYLPHPP